MSDDLGSYEFHALIGSMWPKGRFDPIFCRPVPTRQPRTDSRSGSDRRSSDGETRSWVLHAGVLTIAQYAATSVAYGVPRVAAMLEPTDSEGGK